LMARTRGNQTANVAPQIACGRGAAASLFNPFLREPTGRGALWPPHLTPPFSGSAPRLSPTNPLLAVSLPGCLPSPSPHIWGSAGLTAMLDCEGRSFFNSAALSSLASALARCRLTTGLLSFSRLAVAPPPFLRDSHSLSTLRRGCNPLLFIFCSFFHRPAASILEGGKTGQGRPTSRP
jgi:hypothetical protein